jgi:hypothetical protein
MAAYGDDSSLSAFTFMPPVIGKGDKCVTERTQGKLKIWQLENGY